MSYKILDVYWEEGHGVAGMVDIDGVEHHIITEGDRGLVAEFYDRCDVIIDGTSKRPQSLDMTITDIIHAMYREYDKDVLSHIRSSLKELERRIAIEH